MFKPRDSENNDIQQIILIIIIFNPINFQFSIRAKNMLENRNNIEGQKAERLQAELDELNKKNADLVEKLDTVRFLHS